MHKSFLKSLVLTVVTALALTISPNALAQLVTSGMMGTLSGSDGKVLAGATVTAVHTPTNASFTAVTNAAGRYNFRGLPAGGPYTVSASASGYADVSESDINTELGTDIEVALTLKTSDTKSDVVVLEKFVATGRRNELDAGAIGAGSILSSLRLAVKPSTDRSFADLISSSPLVTLRSNSGDREEAQITALGQNNRYNAVLIDGSSINDRMGLNATGLAAFFNPLSVDTIEQLSVQVSPFDVRLSGFTGASINAVTKSGTNNFHGSTYYYFQGDVLFGEELRGKNERDFAATGRKLVPRLERSTKGFTLGGPIWKDHIFFFLNYEKFDSAGAGRDPRFAIQTSVVGSITNPTEAALLTRLAKYATDSGKAIDWGQPVTSQTSSVLTDKKILAKVDWQINKDHRLTVRHSKTQGELPQFGFFAGNSSNFGGFIFGGISTTPDGHFYSQQRTETSNQVQLFSQWTPSFKTEAKYATQKSEQLTPRRTTAPFITIFGVSGTDLNTNAAVTNGAYQAGTEQFRHGNIIKSDTKEFSFTGDYFLRNMVFSGGLAHEKTDVFNLFRQGSFGLVAFRNTTDFFNDTNMVMQRNVYDPAARNPADISDFGRSSLFGQVKVNVNRRLTIVGGLRYERASADARPTFNTRLFAASGLRNDGSVSGASSFSPRLGFNWSVDEARTTQVRGGVGHFVGRSPWVFFSNSFGSTGVGSFTTFQSAPTLTTYLKDQFDPANPIGTGTDNPDDPTLRRGMAFNDDKIKLPAVWRASFAVDHKLKLLNSMFSVEAVYSKVDQALFIKNENLKPLAGALSADGRARFSGAPSAQTFNSLGPIAPLGGNALYPAFTDLYHASNVSVGKSTYVTMSWDRPMKDNWAFNVAYTRGRSTEAQANGQTTADGYWQRNVVFNQSKVEEGRSDFEIRDRIQISLTRDVEFIKKWKTTTSLYYEGRSGNPFSWVYNQDLNGDGRNNQDTVAVPSGSTDPRFDFSGMTSTQVDNYLTFIQKSGLVKYAGGIAPKNAFYEPWVNRLDLKLVQQIPIHGSAKLSLYFDFINFGSFISKKTFGFTEIVGALSNDVFRTRSLGGAAYAADGRIKPTFTATPAAFVIDNTLSRWRIQVGAKLTF